MPVKRRDAKRRIDAEREYALWSELFLCGFDIFRGEMAELGFPPEKHDLTPDEAREPWRRFGARFLAERKRTQPCWAERHLGPPGAA